MRLFQSLQGMLEAEITSGDIGRTLCRLTDARIPLHQVEVLDCLTARFLISRQYQARLERICRSKGDSLKILRRLGIWWTAVRLLHRPIFTGGLLALTLLFLLLPGRILFIQVEGNRKLPEKLILESAADCGLQFGASRRKLQSEVLKNALLEKLPQLSWAGVNTRGCVAVLSVRERSPEKKPPESTGISSITALRDGIIDSCTAYSGSLQCKPGQAVRAGQVLISGYTDCGSRIRAGQASGEVFARTHRSLEAVFPLRRTKRTVPREKILGFSLVIGKKRINFPWNSRIWDTSCGRMYEEYYITLPGGYVLPAALAVDVYTGCDTAAVSLPSACAEAALDDFAEQYLLKHMAAGTVLDGHREIAQTEALCILRGQYLCREMIGRSRQEKIGE